VLLPAFAKEDDVANGADSGGMGVKWKYSWKMEKTLWVVQANIEEIDKENL
jgi:hypothetical protein